MGDLPRPFNAVEKQCCRNCHFLSKRLKNGSGGYSKPVSWTEDERFQFDYFRRHRNSNELPAGVSFDTVLCYKNVWPQIEYEYYLPTLNVIDSVINEERTDCFHIASRPGMAFETAEELFRIENENKKLRNAHWATVAGLTIAGLGLFLNFIVQVVARNSSTP